VSGPPPAGDAGPLPPAPHTPAPHTLALRERHVAAGARFAPFAGWEMPLQYAGIVAEHEAVRTAAGVFDVSHMGRFWVRGAGAAAAVRSVLTADVRALPPGRAQYALACTPAGGIADDVFVYRLPAAAVSPATGAGADGERWLIVHNAANRAVGAERLAAAAAGAGAVAGGARVTDVTAETVMLALQGPRALAAAAAVLGPAVAALDRRAAVELPWAGGTATVCRTGYTGEDGVEVVAPPAAAGLLWDRWLAAGVVPAGLGARDTLRLEAALPLHGADIGPGTTPDEAGLGWAVTLDDGAEFIGRDALRALRAHPPARRLCCIRLDARGVPRAGYPLYRVGAAGDRSGADEPPVATLTSGAFAPTLRAGIAMAYLPLPDAEPGTPLVMDVRGRRLPATVVRRPFYRGGR